MKQAEPFAITAQSTSTASTASLPTPAPNTLTNQDTPYYTTKNPTQVVLSSSFCSSIRNMCLDISCLHCFTKVFIRDVVPLSFSLR
eukprot:7260962-Ditylum_brightwellii.AAC.1